MTYCCDALRKQAQHQCDEHPDVTRCPDALIAEVRDTAEFGIRVHDGGSSFVKIAYCPWCGSNLSQPATAVNVFLLWHVHRHVDGHEDEKLIGVYSTEQDAVAARQRVHGLRVSRATKRARDRPVSPQQNGWVEGFGDWIE